MRELKNIEYVSEDNYLEYHEDILSETKIKAKRAYILKNGQYHIILCLFVSYKSPYSIFQNLKINLWGLIRYFLKFRDWRDENLKIDEPIRHF